MRRSTQVASGNVGRFRLFTLPRHPLYSLRNPLNLSGLSRIVFIYYILTASSLGIGTGISIVLSRAGIGRRRA